MVDRCAQHEQNLLIHLRFISDIALQTYKIYDIMNIQCKCYILTQSQDIFYMHQVPIVVDYCTKYEQNQPIIFWDITTNIAFKKYIGIITQIWHRGKKYFTCSGNTWYLLTVPNINKINPFFSDITTNTQHVWKMAIITQMCSYRAKCCLTSMSSNTGTW